MYEEQPLFPDERGGLSCQLIIAEHATPAANLIVLSAHSGGRLPPYQQPTQQLIYGSDTGLVPSTEKSFRTSLRTESDQSRNSTEASCDWSGIMSFRAVPVLITQGESATAGTTAAYQRRFNYGISPAITSPTHLKRPSYVATRCGHLGQAPMEREARFWVGYFPARPRPPGRHVRPVPPPQDAMSSARSRADWTAGYRGAASAHIADRIHHRSRDAAQRDGRGAPSLWDTGGMSHCTRWISFLTFFDDLWV